MNIQPAFELSRADVNQLSGAVMLEFGAKWCGYCQAAQSIISSGFALHPYVRHIKIEDGKGRILGRSFNVKIWPTLIFISNGIELKRLVRQFTSEEIGSALNLIAD